MEDGSLEGTAVCYCYCGALYTMLSMPYPLYSVLAAVFSVMKEYSVPRTVLDVIDKALPEYKNKY